MSNTYSLDLESTSSQYASISDASQTGLDITGDFTIECWVKFESLPSSGTQYFVTKDDGTNRSYSFHLVNDSGVYRLQVWLFDPSNNLDMVKSVDVSPSTGVWYHYAVTCDISNAIATQHEFFVNGSSIGNGIVQFDGDCTSIKNSSAEFAVGSYGNGGNYLDGKIDDVRVSNIVRSSAYISSNYNKEIVPDANHVGYWKLNNNYLDETTNNNDLTASGSPVFATDVPFTGDVTISPSVQSLSFTQPAVTVNTTIGITVYPSAQQLTLSQLPATVPLIIIYTDKYSKKNNIYVDKY